MAVLTTRSLVSQLCPAYLFRPMVVTICLCLLQSTGCISNPTNRSPASPLSVEDAPQFVTNDPFFLPAYAEQGQVNPSAATLMKLVEPSLADGRNRELTAYRCVTSSGALAVRAVLTTEGMIIIVKTGGQRRRDGGATSRVAVGSRRQWNELEGRVEESGLWKRPPQRRIRIDGVDGEFWTLEGLRERRYAVLSKWSPRKGDPIRPPCLYLFALAR